MENESFGDKKGKKISNKQYREKKLLNSI